MPCHRNMDSASLDLFIKKLVIQLRMGNFFHSNVMTCSHESSNWRCWSGSSAVQTFRESQSWMIKSLSVQGMFPGQIWLLGQICAGPLWQHKAPFEATQDWAMSRTREKTPKSQYPLFVQDKDMAQGSSLAGRAFCDVPTNGISDKDLAFLMHKAISISSFSLSNGDPNQALNEKHQLYFLHFKPTGQTVGSLFEKCITRNKKNQILFQGRLFF